MKKFIITAILTITILGITFLLWSKSVNQTEKKVAEMTGEIPATITEANNTEFFKLDTLNQDLVAFADEAYKNSDKNNNDPVYDKGVPPFEFFKRIDCQIVYADKNTEKVIKQYTETVSFHAIALLKDSRDYLYDFTLTSTLPDKSIVRLQSYGPLTNENPGVVNLPINERRLKDFPIDFQTNKALDKNDGRCVYIPYPIIGDQAFWLLGNDLKNSPIQGLYRNDRIKNIQEFIDAMKTSFEKGIYY